MPNLAARFLTAAVLVPILVLGLVLLPPIYTLGATVLASLVGAYEVLGMFGHSRLSTARILGTLLGGGSVAIPYFTHADPEWFVLSITGMVVVASTIGLLDRADDLPLAGRRLSGLVVAVFYPGILLAILPLVRRDIPSGGLWVIVLLGTAFLSDTGAYFAGRYLGKHKLAPRLSPNKTIEGAMGGIGGALFATLVAHFWFLPQLSVPEALALGVFGSIAGQAGDLVESLIKRASSVKDAGSVFPGHGGMMDRIDAAVFVGVVYYGYLVMWRYP